MNKGDINRKKAQDYAVYLSENFNHVLLTWATGVGKSLAAIKIIDNDISKRFELTGDWERWYIVVAEKQHITNWEEDIRKHGYGKLLDLSYVEIFCYQSMHKYAGKKANLVLDECHSLTTVKKEVLDSMDSKLIISLSATVDDAKAALLNKVRAYKEYHISIDKAIEADILPYPTIVKVEVTLTSKQLQNYNSYNSRITDYETKIGMYANRILMNDPAVNQSMIDELYTKINRLKVSRKDCLASGKTYVAGNILYILTKAHRKKTIVFAGTSTCAILLGNTILSSMSDKEVQKRLSEFNSGKLNYISVLKMLRQGTNLKGIEAGIICQLDSKPLSFIQMCGRVFRSDKPLVFVLVAKGTIDEVYWNSAVKGLKPDYIKTYEQYLADGNQD